MTTAYSQLRSDAAEPHHPPAPTEPAVADDAYEVDDDEQHLLDLDQDYDHEQPTTGAEAAEAWKELSPWGRLGVYLSFGLLGAGVLLPLYVLVLIHLCPFIVPHLGKRAY